MAASFCASPHSTHPPPTSSAQTPHPTSPHPTSTHPTSPHHPTPQRASLKTGCLDSTLCAAWEACVGWGVPPCSVRRRVLNCQQHRTKPRDAPIPALSAQSHSALRRSAPFSTGGIPGGILAGQLITARHAYAHTDTHTFLTAAVKSAKRGPCHD